MMQSDFAVFLFVAIAVAALFLGAVLFQWLWNSTLPEALGLKRIRYWIAFRLLIIISFVSSGGYWINLGATA